MTTLRDPLGQICFFFDGVSMEFDNQWEVQGQITHIYASEHEKNIILQKELILRFFRKILNIKEMNRENPFNDFFDYNSK